MLILVGKILFIKPFYLIQNAPSESFWFKLHIKQRMYKVYIYILILASLQMSFFSLLTSTSCLVFKTVYVCELKKQLIKEMAYLNLNWFLRQIMWKYKVNKLLKNIKKRRDFQNHYPPLGISARKALNLIKFKSNFHLFESNI